MENMNQAICLKGTTDRMVVRVDNHQAKRLFESCHKIYIHDGELENGNMVKVPIPFLKKGQSDFTTFAEICRVSRNPVFFAEIE